MRSVAGCGQFRLNIIRGKRFCTGAVERDSPFLNLEKERYPQALRGGKSVSVTETVRLLFVLRVTNRTFPVMEIVEVPTGF